MSEHTCAFDCFAAGLERLNLFIRCSKSLDMNSSELLNMRTDLYFQDKGDEIVVIRDTILATRPDLASDPAVLLKEIMSQQKKREEDLQNQVLNDYHQLRDELVIMQVVAMADGYRSELTELLLRERNDVLRRHKNDILKLLSEMASESDWNDIYDEIVRSGVNSFTRQRSYKGWLDKVQADFSLSFALDRKDIARLEETIATRNLIAHASTVINSDYLHRSEEYYRLFGISPPQVGDKRTINHSYCREAIDCISRIIESVDVSCYTFLIRESGV